MSELEPRPRWALAHAPRRPRPRRPARGARPRRRGPRPGGGSGRRDGHPPTRRDGQHVAGGGSRADEGREPSFSPSPSLIPLFPSHLPHLFPFADPMEQRQIR